MKSQKQLPKQKEITKEIAKAILRGKEQTGDIILSDLRQLPQSYYSQKGMVLAKKPDM